MRCVLFVVALGLTASCDRSQKQTNEVERMEHYTEQNTPQQSRPQIRFYAESEGKLRPIEKEVRTLHERVKAGLVMTPGKQAALVVLETSVATARAKVSEVNKVGAGDWEALKPGVEEALANVQKYYAAMNETP